MNITFLLGNGFDLGLGLNTGYESFYKKYSQILGTEKDYIVTFKVLLMTKDSDNQQKIIDWADFEKAFGEFSIFHSLKDKQKYIDCFEDFVINFNAYLMDEEKRVDYSNAANISNIMNTAVNTYYHIRPEDKDIIQSIYNSADSYRKFNFISFNYTRTVDECAKILKNHLRSYSSQDVGDVIHIHGYLEENMIMGVNDASQIINEELAKDKGIIREIVKPQQNSDMRTNYEKQVMSVIDSSRIICIYGMSIGETDKKWWSYIAKWLAQNDKRALIILKYDQKFDKRFPFNHNKFIDDITEKFLTLSDQSKEIQTKIRSQIFVGMNRNVFSMNLVTNEELAKENLNTINNETVNNNNSTDSISIPIKMTLEDLENSVK